MENIKKDLEKLYFALPQGWEFVDEEDGDLALYVGENCYAYYNDEERLLTINATTKNIRATFYVLTNIARRFDIKKQIMRFIDAEGSLACGFRDGFTLLAYNMSETALEQLMEEEAEYITPIRNGCSWKQRADGINYLEDKNGKVVTAYDRHRGTYVYPFSTNVYPIPKKIKDEEMLMEVLENKAFKIAARMEKEA